MEIAVDICTKNTALNKKVIEKVSGVNEESITDYLIWKWAEIDPNCSYFSTQTHNRMKESGVTGSDFELWIRTKSGILPLSIQAKKFVKQTDSYHRKLRYPNNTNAQMDMLFDYAKKNKMFACYAFYTIPDVDSKTIGGHPAQDFGVFLALGTFIKNLMKPIDTTSKKDKKTKSPVITKNDILKETIPLHALFCCGDKLSIAKLLIKEYRKVYQLSAIDFREFFPKLQDCPKHIQALFDKKPDGAREIFEAVHDDVDVAKEPSNKPRHIIAYDLTVKK
ncbi:DUF6615 family protein [Pseudoalteromonas umbrosa]|uniref:DUF6615 family protein n=1 Tax=Pseudoalteromonas umbrosa TaxID=3048489 RepID=UPI0024C39572|nr:DUF6615 family protein [Pseudoalteromonas sp. B95]MDK1286301.1 hypothetical protein [Pseudoalteromonas sp. B95]